jgi:hypothetical protein
MRLNTVARAATDSIACVATGLRHPPCAPIVVSSVTPHPSLRPRTGKSAVWRRWLGIVLRSLHLVAVSLLALAVHGLAVPGPLSAAGWVLVSGALLLSLELADGRLRLLELAGLLVLAKLALVALMVWRGEWLTPLFWGLLFVSAIGSHAPRRWRHWPTRAPQHD